jgi:hypothetical protein
MSLDPLLDKQINMDIEAMFRFATQTTASVQTLEFRHYRIYRVLLAGLWKRESNNSTIKNVDFN